MHEKRLAGKTVLVTAGPTRERLDPVRFLSNFSSGKMGYAIAGEALALGARVLLVTGPVALRPPEGCEVTHIESTLDLLDAMLKLAPACDVIIQSAAPADYRPETMSDTKIKKQAGEPVTLKLIENPDVAAAIGHQKREGQVLVVFAAETDSLEKNATSKLIRKNADFIVANDVTKAGAGFNVDTNIASIIDKNGVQALPLMQKTELARIILHKAADMLDR